jgi:sec-independent protein translocase protein TatB
VFDISWPDFMVLIVAGLFILGPERLPGAARWLGQSIRKVREYANGARDSLTSELGPEFDEIRKPLQDLRSLRNFDPRRAVTQHLLDATGGYDPRDDLKVDGLSFGSPSNGAGIKPNGFPTPATQQPKLAPGERPPFDPDAT